MSWRDLFRRAPPEPAEDEAATRLATELEQLAQTGDPHERTRIARRLAKRIQLAQGQLSNSTQGALWDIEDQLRSLLQEQMGVTNEMLGDVLALVRETRAALLAARAEFQQVAETVSDHDLRLTAIESEMGSFRGSRDQSIADRQELFRELDESRQDRVAIHRELHEARVQRDEMAQALQRIERAIEHSEQHAAGES